MWSARIPTHEDLISSFGRPVPVWQVVHSPIPSCIPAGAPTSHLGGPRMTRRAMTPPRSATLPEIENLVRQRIDADIVLIETGYFMTAAAQSAERLAEQFGYQMWERRDGVRMTGLPTAGISRKLDELEAAGFIVAVVGKRPPRHSGRAMLYVTGDPRGTPRRRTAADAIGLPQDGAADAPASNTDVDTPVSAAAPQRSADAQTSAEAIACADRLLDLRIELMSSIWDQFVEARDPVALGSLFVCERLQRTAQQIAKRPVRRRREGDEVWTEQLDRHVIEWFVSGRTLAEIARSVDRPTPVTVERLDALGYPGGLWPAWDEEARTQRDVLIDVGHGLHELARVLRRSPWDIIESLSTPASRSGQAETHVSSA